MFMAHEMLDRARDAYKRVLHKVTPTVGSFFPGFALFYFWFSGEVRGGCVLCVFFSCFSERKTLGKRPRISVNFLKKIR